MAKKTLTIEKTPEDSLLAEIRDFASKGVSADKHNRDHSEAARSFLNGDQWTETDKKDREGRPCLVINRINPAIDQAVGDQRQNLPGIKVRPIEGDAQAEWALIKEDKIRHIVNQLSAQIAIDKAAEHQLQGGSGYMRVVTEFAGDDTFDQVIRLKPIYNSLSVVYDASAVEWDRCDGNACLVYTKISKKTYKELYGEEPSSIDVPDSVFAWREDEEVTVAEYFKKEYEKKTIYLLADGSVTEDDKVPEIITPVLDDLGNVIDQKTESAYALDENGKPRSRTLNSYKIYRYKVDGAKILEEKQLWPSKYWPIIPVWGKEIDVAGKTHRRGITKDSMDSQRMYNFYASAGAESFALAPKVKLMATPEMVAGHEGQWNSMNRGNFPYLLVNAIDPEDPKSIMWPQPVMPPQASSAIVTGLQQAAEDIRFTTGKHLASLGATSNETSGVAINARKIEGEVGDFAFTDNLNRALLRVGEICLDLFPVIYDRSGRKIRTLGEDGISSKEVVLNEPASQVDNVPLSSRGFANDMKEGKYEPVLSIGPSFTTARQETAQFYTAMMQTAPATAVLFGDIIMKNQDIPEAQTVANRIQAEMVRSGKEYLLTDEELENLRVKLPRAIPQPQGPDPAQQAQMVAMQLQLEQQKLKTEADGFKAEKAALEVDKAKLEIGLSLESFKQDFFMKIEERLNTIMGGNSASGASQTGQASTNPGATGNGQGITPVPVAVPMQGRAYGGPVEAGTPYVVGEQGPEFVIPDVKAPAMTVLAPQEERQFQGWIKQLPWYSEFIRNYGEAPNLNDTEYDYRAAWKNGITPTISKVDDLYHWADSGGGRMLKSPNHPNAWMDPFITQFGINPDDLPATDPRVVAYKNAWYQKYPPRRASGGPVLANKPYIVGEDGPEVIVPQGDGVVIPNPGPQVFQGYYDPQLDYQERVKEAYQLGVEPPQSPDPRHMMEYRSRVAPLLEQQGLQGQNEIGARWHGGRWDDRPIQNVSGRIPMVSPQPEQPSGRIPMVSPEARALNNITPEMEEHFRRMHDVDLNALPSADPRVQQFLRAYEVLQNKE